MGHEIDTSTGDAAFTEIGDRLTAWHQHGNFMRPEDLIGLPAKAKIIKVADAAILNWTVDPFDIFDGGGRLIKGWKEFLRSDTDFRMGIFPETYTILQNMEMLMLVEPLLEQGMIEFETAGSLRSGRDVWALFRFNSSDPVVQEYFAEEKIIPYQLLTNNHAYETLLAFLETMVKVVCKNTLGMAMNAMGGSSKKRKAGRYPGGILLRHTKNVKSLSVEGVTELWGQMTERYAAVKNSYEAMKQRFLTEEEFAENVLDLIAPLPEDHESPMYPSTLERASFKREVVTELWNGAGLGIEGDHSAYEAYQATAEALDHYDDVFPTRVDRLQAIYRGGSLADKKQDVLNALTTLT